MALCYKPDDIAKSCDSSDLAALSGGLAINIKAFKPTKSVTLKFTLEDIDIVDPDTGLYPSASGVKEVASLDISAAASATGNVIVTLDGTPTNVAVLTADSAIVVAGKIRATPFTGFVASGTGANVVFTATAVGEKADAVYSEGTTGAVGVVVTTTQGYSASAYYPIKVEWNKNAVQPNYEVVSSDVKRDTYTHIVPSVIINNSESAKGKETIVALTDEKYVFVYKASGTADADDAYQVLGAKNGMQFVVEPTSAELGGRVTGSFRSLTGGAEGNPNGLNFLMSTGIEATDTKFNNRFSTVVIP